jgi:hypothetical protein
LLVIGMGVQASQAAGVGLHADECLHERRKSSEEERRQQR